MENNTEFSVAEFLARPVNLRIRGYVNSLRGLLERETTARVQAEQEAADWKKKYIESLGQLTEAYLKVNTYARKEWDDECKKLYGERGTI